SEQSSGMHPYAVWTALSAEGLGCNLQHSNLNEEFTRRVKEQWKIPTEWNFRAQSVFGIPKLGPERDETFKPVETRLEMYGSQDRW
ncbi:hypothetical protein BJ546DRAFT_843090, partial [Cryomyces antarcticus]